MADHDDETTQHLYEPNPGALHVAEAQLKYDEYLERTTCRIARWLLENPEVNANRVHPTLNRTEEAAVARSLDALLPKFAPHGLKLFCLGGPDTTTFSVSPENAASFLRSLLTPVAEERFRREAALSRGRRVVEYVPSWVDSDAAAEVRDHSGGIFKESSFEGSLHETHGEETHLTDTDRAQLHIGELEELLSHQRPKDETWQSAVRDFILTGRKLINEAFAVEPTLPDDFIEQIWKALSEAFDQFAPSVPIGGRKAYAGLILTVAVLRGKSLEPSKAREMVHEALKRARKRKRDAESESGETVALLDEVATAGETAAAVDPTSEAQASLAGGADDGEPSDQELPDR